LPAETRQADKVVVDVQGRLFVWSVILLGALAVSHAALDLVREFPDPAWLVVAGLTLVSGIATIRLPNVQAEISISETFLFSAVLIFGPSAGVITVLLDAAIINLKMASRGLGFERALFNLAAPSLALWLGANCVALAGVPPVASLPHGESISLPRLIGPLVLFTLVYFAFNSGLVAIAIGLAKKVSPYRVWQKHFAWLSLNYFGGASISSLLVVVYSREQTWTFIAVVVPLLLILYMTFRASMARVADANQHIAELNQLYLATVQSLAAAIDAKDQVTHGHINRVQRYARELAIALGVRSEIQLKAIQAAAVLHDTGKIAIPEAILNKPGPLTPDEFAVMKQHANIGADIVSSVNFPYPVEPIVRYHHENWDGSGYPEGLVGTSIPIGARILSVVDCYDALTSDRPYRGKLSDGEAARILLARRGNMYDPLIVDTFLRIREALVHEEPSQPTRPSLAGAELVGLEPARRSA
jgi:putative nucleotidyltransferase with HDIG domain